MLTCLYIKNFAIIKQLEIEFHPNMTCLTGETGAGKSIIIDSLELALGERADTSLIYGDGEHCEINAIFDLTNLKSINDWLINNNYESSTECLIRRIITRDGRSKSTINGYPISQQSLRYFRNLIIGIHGQHENQILSNSDYQLELLDAFADNDFLLGQLKELYENWHKNQKNLIGLQNLTKNQESELELLYYQLSEFNSIELDESIDSLRIRQKQLSQLKQFAKKLNDALEFMTENENPSLLKKLHEIKNSLEFYENTVPEVKFDIQLLNNSIIQLEELICSFKNRIKKLDFNDNEYDNVEKKMELIYSLARKHRVFPQELAEVKEKLAAKLISLNDLISQLEIAQERLLKSERSYLKIAKILSERRKFAAVELANLVSEKIRSLAMPKAKFEINLTLNSQPFSSTGLEKVEFLASLNPGYPKQPISKIASGGELSRLSLAIQATTAEKKTIPTLIFDEIDAGVGGKTANIVGELLFKLARNCQVICITHLPQIASQAQTHLVIEKEFIGKATEIKLKKLTENNERLNEIVRMLGGNESSKPALEHAREMLEKTNK